MHALITNGVATKYPYTVGDLRRDNPQTSFPKAIPEQVLANCGMVEVQVQAQPSYDQRTQRVETSSLPTLVNGAWTITKSVVNKTQEQIDADTANKSVEVRNKRNELLTESDWTQLPDSPVDRALWASYRQSLRDVTLQAGFPWNVTWPAKPE
jgi:hypothetical protein